MRMRYAIFSALLACTLTGCPSEDESSCPPDDGVMDDEMFPPAECPDSIPELRQHMNALGQSGMIRAELVDADKIPLGWFYNAWTVRFTGPDGEPLQDVALDKVEPFMTVHNHGTTPVEVEDLDDGEFGLSKINITMGGPWEVRLTVSAGDVSDFIVFDVCNSQPKPVVNTNACE
jgi:hypothetical protein